MRIAFLTAVGAAFAGLFPVIGLAAQGDHDVTLTTPIRHDNLEIYFVRGRSDSGPVPLTLAEALDKGSVRVIETGSVNDLMIETLGKDSVFIQAGDIVKGGQQDRVLMSSLLLTPGSGKVSIGSFCVEAGRWAPRGKEDAKQFSSSAEAVPSRVAKLVLNAAPSQTEAGGVPTGRVAAAPDGTNVPASQRRANVQMAERSARSSDTSTRQKKIWDEVAGMQAKLKANTGAAVAAEASKTSLQLSLENERVRELRQLYVKALDAAPMPADVIGFIVAINGRISSAELYPSNALFKKMWPKQLASAATEAIADKPAIAAAPMHASAMVSKKDAEDFLAAARNGKSAERKIGSVSDFTHIDSGKALFVEARTATGQWYHRSYVAK